MKIERKKFVGSYCRQKRTQADKKKSRVKCTSKQAGRERNTKT
jgi:hypothetical protein